MYRFLKVVAKIAALLIVLYLIAVVLLLEFVKPDTYKPLITKAFRQATGRELIIQGKIALTAFPLPGIEAHQILISNPSGFKAPPPYNYFAKIGHAKLDIAILPLFKGQIRPSHLQLSNANLNLITMTNGKNNWDSFLNHQNKTSPEKASKIESQTSKTSKKTNLNQIQIPIIVISTTNLHWLNLKTNNTININDIDLRTKHFNNNIYELKLTGLILRKKPNTVLRIRSTSDVNIQPEKTLYQFSHLEIVLEMLEYKTVKHPTSIEFNGNLSIEKHHLQANLKGLLRSHRGTINLTLEQQSNQLNAALDIQDLPIGRILEAFNDQPYLTGNLLLKTKINIPYASGQITLAQPQGSGQLKITDGSIYGFDIQNTLLSTINSALFGKNLLQIEPQKEKDKTSFKAISSHFKIKNGILSTKDLSIQGDQLQGQGEGTVNLLDETLDFKLLTTYTPKPKWKLPLRITGSIYAPRVHPDTEAMASDLYKTHIKKDVDKTLDKMKQLFD